jgi:nucleoside-diphosphate-sugar epimerase
MSSNELHVIFGSGPAGLSVMDELVARNRAVRMVNRSGAAPVPHGVQVVAGNAADPQRTREVCRGATVVYNCTNAPDYHRWPDQFPPLQEGIIAGAAAHGATLVVLENLYMYGPHGGATLTEDMPLNGRGSRSTTRARMARDLLHAHHSGRVQAVSGRASDFFGPRVRSSTMGEQVFKPALKGRPAQVLISADMPHTYTYMPDIGKALVLLAEHPAAWGQAWHIPNPPTVTTREFISMIYEETGHPLNIMVAPEALIRAMELFVPPIRGLSENFYQFEEPYIVSHCKFAQAFGVQATPLRQAIRETVAWYRVQGA